MVTRAAGFALSLFHCSFAAAAACFAAAIFVNSSLTFVSASAVSLPARMFPLRAVAVVLLQPREIQVRWLGWLCTGA